MSVLVVATLLEGRQFPSKPKSEIYVTCKFAGELLNSDPVPHTSAPYFNTELAWELTKKTLHQHRLQRTPLKLTFYTKSLAGVEEVGHIMLDLRSISTTSSEYKWYPLARCKYRTHKPQIRLLLSSEVPEEKDQTTEGDNNTSKKLFVSLDEASGCYQVGSPKSTNPLHVLSLTVIAAAQLTPLIDNKRPAAFFFRFNLLDNLITNSSFVNAANPDFPIERVSIKLRGELADVYRFLATQRAVSIQLCQGEEVIGVSEIPLTSLLTADGDNDNVNILHSCLPLRHPARIEEAEENSCSAEVLLTIKEEGRKLPAPMSAPMPAPISAPSAPPRHSKSPDTEELLLPSDTNLAKSPKPQEAQTRLRFDSSPSRPGDLSPVSSMSPDPDNCCMWMCNLQLNNAKLNKSGKYYVRYVYPFFGTSAPHSTSVVRCTAGETTPLPPSCCGYSFAASRPALSQQFTKVPLVLQLWRKGSGEDALEGTAVISLAPLLTSGLQHMFGKIISRDSDKEIGDIQASGWLEEKGMAPKPVVTEPKQHEHRVQTEREKPEYKAALELELWKELKQEEFMKELDDRAEARMKQITVEWKKKELERDEEVKKQVTEYSRLKEKMKIALKDLSERENMLIEQERKMLLAQEDMTRERSRLTNDVREASRRVEEDFEHKLRLQKQKLASLERQNKDLQNQVEEAEMRLEKRSAELVAAREAQLSAPSTKLHTELEVLKMEKEEMERKISSLEKGKLHYKESWTKALKELINVREKSQQQAKRRLHQEQTLMEHARLRYLSLEDNKLKSEMNTEVEVLKDEIQKLKENNKPIKLSQAPSETQLDEKIGRLIEERNSLLNTGVYTKDDNLIKELDEKIRVLQS